MAHDSRYILAKKIARGGMAEIFLAKQVGEDGFQRLCAVKRILPHYAQDKEFIEMFRDEAHICKRLQHANIVRVEGFEEVDGSYAIIMEFVDGTDLRSILSACEKKQKRLNIPMTCQIVAEAARGLHYAHTKVDEITHQPLAIVHRDVSPQNILLSFEGEVKITDFGIADADSKLTETKPGIVKGKYSYMSPEQISAKQVDARSDVFALGIVLWEILCMKRLFYGENEVETIQLVKNGNIPNKPSEVNSSVDNDLDCIVARSLAKDPKKRYQSAGELEKDLRRYINVKYPDFTTQDLGVFLKQLLDKKRAESAADIKKTLTETKLKPGRKPKLSRNRSVDLAMDDSKSVSFTVARAAGSTANSNHGTSTKRPATSGRIAAPSSNVNQLGSSRVSRPPVLPRGRRPQRSTNPVALFMVTLGAVFLAFIAWVGIFNPPDQLARVKLRTNPARVKLTLDGAKIENGRYVKVPVGFNLPPGKHTLLIQRKGYKPEKIVFNTVAGKEIEKDASLEKKPGVVFAPVYIRPDPGDRKIGIDIDNGYFRHEFNKKPRWLPVLDLEYGKPHIIKVKTPRSVFKCKIVPKSVNWNRPVRVTIAHRKRKCLIKD